MKSSADNGFGPRFWAWIKGKIGRKADRSFRVRIVVQAVFAGVTLLIGLQLVRFYLAALAGTTPLPVRPPGVEGFLPISGIMGILDWGYQGRLNPIHPAATILIFASLKR